VDIPRVIPVLTAEDMERTRDFYVDFLGFRLVQDLGWLFTVGSTTNPTAEITVLRADPGAAAVPSVTVEVLDVDAVHADAVARGIEVVYPLRSEPWGVRRFFLVDPTGAVINVMSHIR